MLRLWGKIYKNSRVIQDLVYENDSEDLTTGKKLKLGLYELCMAFDLQMPMWLESNTKELKKFKLTSFRKEHFIEEIDFDCFEIEIIEE